MLHYLLSYADAYIDDENVQVDVKELLNETLLFIGYFCLENETNQTILQRGENCILQKLCNLPFVYFMDKINKEILYPTFISVGYKNERNLSILDQEIDMNILIKYLEQNLKSPHGLVR